MDIEVRTGKSSNAFVEAVIKSFSENDGILIQYKNSDSPPQKVPITSCYVARKDRFNENDLTNADSVIKIGAIVEVLSANLAETGGVAGWSQGKIKKIENNFIVLENAEKSSLIDIVTINDCRAVKEPIQLTSSMLKTEEIDVPEDMVEYFNRPDSYNDLIRIIGDIAIDYKYHDGGLGSRSTGKFIISTYNPSSLKKVKILSDIYFYDTRQKMALVMKKDEVTRLLSQATAIPKHIEEFTVSASFMGLAIGTHGANILAARDIQGIEDIQIDETTRGDDGLVVFKIYADNKEAAEKARAILEYKTGEVKVPRNMVGKMIGKQGKTIQDIVDKSGTIRVQIGEEKPLEKDVEGEEGKPDFVEFIFTGTSEAISNAEFLIEFHLKHLQEMDEMREEVDDLSKQLYKQPIGDITREYNAGGRGGRFNNESNFSRSSRNSSRHGKPYMNGSQKNGTKENGHSNNGNGISNGSNGFKPPKKTSTTTLDSVIEAAVTKTNGKKNKKNNKKSPETVIN
uniref:KH domain-containing protein n=1 Tax=Parastrongyloides trichosuri TaxID=131310 RepID=A0A0N4ZQJ2_PARTI